mmetsp:Transcript_50669/g.146090  ORF Transcript_50669/g.146090 Transcript_50669/m.146090 type:complete len:300 (-) Transcript_50669:475-1374(-)
MAQWRSPRTPCSGTPRSSSPDRFSTSSKRSVCSSRWPLRSSAPRSPRLSRTRSRPRERALLVKVLRRTVPWRRRFRTHGGRTLSLARRASTTRRPCSPPLCCTAVSAWLRPSMVATIRPTRRLMPAMACSLLRRLAGARTTRTRNSRCTGRCCAFSRRSTVLGLPSTSACSSASSRRLATRSAGSSVAVSAGTWATRSPPRRSQPGGGSRSTSIVASRATPQTLSSTPSSWPGTGTQRPPRRSSASVAEPSCCCRHASGGPLTPLPLRNRQCEDSSSCGVPSWPRVRRSRPPRRRSPSV